MTDKESLTEADIDTMKQGKVYKLLPDFGMDVEDFDDLEDAKTALKEKIRELKIEADKATSAEQVSEMMASVAESYRANRELLLQRCHDVIAYLPTLDEGDRETLTLNFKRDVMEILGEVQGSLSKDDCPILVAGETSAGKSTLLNLLLGEGILPVAHLSSTSTICELKYGETRQALVHLREPDPATGSTSKVVSLSTNREECRQQLEPYIHLRTERKTLPIATKIEIFWPLAFLKGGVTVVDSPGVGESEMMDEIVARYIPSAFAFIYIINSSSTGHWELLRQLLKKCKPDKNARSVLKQFDTTKAIFVLNKWDLVPAEERQEVKEDAIRKLREMWEGLDESQVFVHSNTEAFQGGFRSAGFNKLLDGIYELLPQSFDHKLETQYRQMTSILEEALHYVKLKLNGAFSNLDDDMRRSIYLRARTALSQFDESTSGIMRELRGGLENATETAKTILAEFLRGTELKERLVHDDAFWFSLRANTDDDVVKDACSWLANEMDLYSPFYNHISDVKQRLEFSLGEMARRVRLLYDELVCPITGRRCHLNVEELLSQDNHNLWRIIKMALMLLFPIGIFFGPMRPNAPIKTRPSREHASSSSSSPSPPSSQHPYGHSNRSRLSELAIAAFASEEMLTEVVGSNLSKPTELLSEFESDLLAMKEVDRRLVDERFAETRSQMDLVSTYEPQANEITMELGRLAMVELGEMRKHEFDLDSIIGWPDSQNRIAGGSYGEVYRVQVQRGGSLVRAALKVGVLPYDLTTEGNAWEFLAEEENLRRLKGEHIVEYYGTACRREERGLKLGLVMELCEGTLESRIIGQNEHNPAWWGRDPVKKQRAFSYIQDKAIQLCAGLMTIHDAGYIHRDLKLSNILVTAGGVVKLADVGMTKREVEVTGSITGTATYAAPEVKERKVSHRSADIYSLGLILWEMWYGRTVDDRSLRGLTGGLSLTMPPFPGSIRPIREWAILVRDCLHWDPRRRPTALQCLQRIRDMTTEGRVPKPLP